MICNVCKSEKVELAFIKNKYQILQCTVCDHLFTELTLTQDHADLIYSDGYFTDGGDGYDDYLVEKDMLILRGENYADKVSKFMSPGKVLDIGAAAGFLLKGFENKGWHGTGIELNETMAEHGRNIVGVNIKRGAFENIIIDEKFDLVILIQVVAHLYDLHTSLNKIYDSLNPGGYLLIETWNKDSLIAKLFGKNWHEFSPPSVLNFFSKKSLMELMSQHNFSLVAQGRPKKSIHSKHAKSILKHKFGAVPGFSWMNGIINLIPDDKILPYPSEDLFWYLLRKIQ